MKKEIKLPLLTQHSIVIERNNITAILNDLLSHYPYESCSAPDLQWLMPAINKSIADVILQHTRGNQAKATRMLGIHRVTLKRFYDEK